MNSATSVQGQKDSKKAFAIAAMILFLGVTCYLFRGILLHPAHSVVSVGGDGGKNMFTYIYHVLYDHGIWFSGMNYPFGEHIIFTDAQPALSVTLAFLNQWLHLTPGTLLGIMYYLVAFSFWLGMWYTYKLLLRFGTNPVIAMAAAACIIILSPQMLRTTGHFPLSYSTFLPMLFLWSLGYYETGSRKYLVWLTLLCTLYALLHMYFLGMAMIWMLAYIGGYLILVRRPFSEKVKHVAGYGLSIGLAFVIIQLLIATTDPIKDRPVYPLSNSGFNWPTELVSTSVSPIWEGIKELGAQNFVTEGTQEMPYLGVVVLLMCLVGFIRFIANVLRKKPAPDRSFFGAQWIFIAIATLVFATTISAIWDVSFLKSLLKPLRQFRAPERFGWIFYYVMSIYSAVLLSNIFQRLYQRGYRLVGVGLVVVLFAIWAIDANGYIVETGRGIPAYAENYDLYFSPSKNWTKVLTDNHKKPADFQAVLALPYEHNGSEKLWLGEGFSLGTVLGFMVALETKLPLMNVMMSRTSWSQTFDQVKIGAGIYAGKPIFNSFNSDKPLLLLHYKAFPLTPDEAFIVDNADRLGTFNGCDLYALYPQKILKLQEAEWQNIARITANMPAGDTVIEGNQASVFIQHFSDQKPGIVLAGNGGQSAIKIKDSIFSYWKLPVAADTGLYEISVWTKLNDIGPQHNYYTLYCRDSVGKELSHEDVLTKASMDNLPGFWFRAAKVFSIPTNTAGIEIHVYNPNLENYLALDELLIRPVTRKVISKFADGTVFVNNHRITPRAVK